MSEQLLSQGQRQNDFDFPLNLLDYRKPSKTSRSDPFDIVLSPSVCEVHSDTGSFSVTIGNDRNDNIYRHR